MIPQLKSLELRACARWSWLNFSKNLSGNNCAKSHCHALAPLLH